MAGSFSIFCALFAGYCFQIISQSRAFAIFLAMVGCFRDSGLFWQKGKAICL
jgi:hypothetical protein